MFKDLFDAGKQLAQELQEFKNAQNTLVLAIPQAGVSVGFEIARELSLPFDIILSKKIGYPGNPDYTIGAVSLDNVIVDKRVLEFSGDMEEYLKKEISKLRQKLREEASYFYGERIPGKIENNTIIVVDDGISTGKNMEVTIDLVKKMLPKKIVIAVPVASKEAIQLIKRKVDEIVTVIVPELFVTKSYWYQNYLQMEQEQVVQLLQSSYVK